MKRGTKVKMFGSNEVATITAYLNKWGPRPDGYFAVRFSDGRIVLAHHSSFTRAFGGTDG